MGMEELGKTKPNLSCNLGISLQESLRTGSSQSILSPKDLCPSETGEALLYDFQDHLQILLFSLSVCLVLYKL